MVGGRRQDLGAERSMEGDRGSLRTAFPAASSFPMTGKESVQRAKAWRMEHVSEVKMDVR